MSSSLTESSWSLDKSRGTPHLIGTSAPLDSMAVILVAGDGAITAWKAGAQRMFGYHEREVLGRAISEIEYIGTETNGACVFIGATTDEYAERERMYRHKNGRRVRYLSSAVTLDNLGCGTRMWFIRDKGRDDAHQSSEELPRRDKAACPEIAKDHYLAVMAHELKQPLATLMLNIDWLLERAIGHDVQGVLTLCDVMRRSVRRQARIIDDLFDLSRMRTGKLKLDLTMVDVDEIVRSITCDFAGRVTDRVLRVDFESSARRWCMADPIRLEQILSNLLDNAVKFSGSGGIIEVRVATVDGYVIVSVADNGCGIAADFLPHVFRMFGQDWRGRRYAKPGMGIGLALVQELAKGHRGRVDVHSNGEGCGARFTLWLPISDHSSANLSATEISGAPSTSTALVSVEMSPKMLTDRLAAQNPVV